MSLLKDVIGYGVHADRPAAASEGRIYYETDTDTIFRDNGTGWDAMSLGASVPTVHCTNSAAISVIDSTFTVLTFDTNRFDQGTATAQHSTTVNTSRLTCQDAGIYLITGGVSFSPNSTGYRAIYFRVNGSTYIAADKMVGLSSVDATDQSLVQTYKLNVSDYVELIVYQTSGSTLTVEHNPQFSPEFSMSKLAA